MILMTCSILYGLFGLEGKNEFSGSFFLFGSSFVTARGGFSRLLGGMKESKL